MLARLGQRLAAGIAVICGVVVLTFLLLHLVPGDPVEIMLGPNSTAEQRADQRTALGLDRPLPSQFATWTLRFVRGAWGTRIAQGQPGRRLLGAAWPSPAVSGARASRRDSRSAASSAQRGLRPRVSCCCRSC